MRERAATADWSAEQHAAVVLDATSVLVKPEVASRQLDEERQRTAGPTAADEQEAGTGTTDEHSARGHPAHGHQPSRAHQSVSTGESSSSQFACCGISVT